MQHAYAMDKHWLKLVQTLEYSSFRVTMCFLWGLGNAILIARQQYQFRCLAFRY